MRRECRSWSTALAFVLGCLLLLGSAGCSLPMDGETPDGRDGIRFSLVNTGESPLDCRLRFGHWVDRDLGALDAGRAIEFPVSQDTGDGALYVTREDGKRRMMIETIECWLDGDWLASFGQVDLAPARALRPRAIVARCRHPAEGGRVACEDLLLEG